MTIGDDQLKKLTANKRSVLPTYYSSVSGVSIPIPSSTEDALILLSSTTKKRAVDYLKSLTKGEPSKQTRDYNALLSEVTEHQVAYSTLATVELETITGKFNEFYNSFTGTLDSAGLTIQVGMSPVLQAMTKTLGRIIDIDSYERFHRQFDSVMEAQHKRDEAHDVKKELRSWIRAFVSYP